MMGRSFRAFVLAGSAALLGFFAPEVSAVHAAETQPAPSHFVAHIGETSVVINGVQATSPSSMRLTYATRVPSNDPFFTWYNEGKRGKTPRKTVEIEAKNASGATTMTWILRNALPTSYQVGPLDAQKSAVQVAKVVLSYESYTTR